MIVYKNKLIQIDHIPESAILNRFITKTCLTTYTYLTTYAVNGSTTIESREKVISNIATEERNTHHVTPLVASDMTFFKVIIWSAVFPRKQLI
jgi:hypothetical protein